MWPHEVEPFSVYTEILSTVLPSVLAVLVIATKGGIATCISI